MGCSCVPFDNGPGELSVRGWLSLKCLGGVDGCQLTFASPGPDQTGRYARMVNVGVRAAWLRAMRAPCARDGHAATGERRRLSIPRPKAVSDPDFSRAEVLSSARRIGVRRGCRLARSAICLGPTAKQNSTSAIFNRLRASRVRRHASGVVTVTRRSVLFRLLSK